MTAPEQPDVLPPESPASPPIAAPAPPAPGAAGDLTAQLAAAKKDAAENYERFLRVSADLENFRKRMLREKEELRLSATARVLEDLLSVLDNLALGLAAAKQPGADAKTLATGIELVLGQFKTALTKHGLKEINPAAGESFDPHQHESLSHQPSADVPAEHVLSVVRTGFALNGRLLRPASVVLSGGPAKEEKKR
jgi:molecular chaperone GrpE